MKPHFNSFTLNIGGQLKEYHRPQIMGILNVTPDSFYAGSRTMDERAIRERVEMMIAQGADMIDIGGYSSRPGADEVTPREELRRLETGMKVVRDVSSDIVVSVDTFRADVARQSVESLGVNIVNDISGGSLDNDMFETVASLRVPYILMHMRGTPETMQSLTQYDHVTRDVITELGTKVQELSLMGVNDIIIDPGFGFSKTVEQNYQLMRELSAFEAFNRPVLVGISRKSMIYKPLGLTPAESLNGTTVLNVLALLNCGASILRVHDVAQARQVVDILGLTYPQLYK
jgi:dihydropteroate synthase